MKESFVATGSVSAAPAGSPMKGNRLDVQGLRALAVIIVITNHLLGYPAGGFIGVDVFFVISGYLITGLLLREHARAGRISIRGFYARRARRILPASAVVLAATVMASAMVLVASRASTAVIDAFWAAIFLGNWRMAATGTDYFQLGLPPSPVQHFWSLSVEEQFYFVWPILLIGVLAIAASRRLTTGGTRSLVAVVLAAIVGLSFVWALVETVSNPTLAYFSTFSRVWELGIGALAATVVMRRFTELPAPVRAAASWIGIAGIVASALLVREDVGFPAPGALLAVLATALVLVAGSGAPSATYDQALFPLTNRVARYLGDISYSLYLWHFPVIVLLLSVFPAGSRKYYVGAAGLVLLLSVLTFHFVEQPVRRSNWLSRYTSTESRRHPLRRRRKAVFASIIAASAVVILVAGTTVVAARSTAEPDAAAPISACSGAAAVGNAEECADEPAASALIPSLDGYEDDTGISFSCYRGESADLRTCSYGQPTDTSLRVALVGDSHAASLLPAIEPLLGQQDWTLDTFVGFGCQWKINPGSDCGAVMDQIQDRLTDPDEPYDIIITTAARWSNGDDVDAATALFADTWGEATANGTRVMAVADNPSVSEGALQCITRVGFEPGVTDCSTPRTEALAVTDPLPLAAAAVDGAVSIDLTDIYCAAESCPAVIGGVIVYRDTSGHLTATFSTTVGPFLMDAIDRELESAP